jgi:hypothetical protein
MKFEYIKYKNIDKENWNRTIRNSVNNLTYAFSWYLDAICNWDAIISEDYSIIMPLPFHKKMNFYTIYQPKFAPKLGVFYTSNITKNQYESIINTIPIKFLSNKIFFNKFNFLNKSKNLYYKNVNSIDLNQTYISILEKYSTEIKKIIINTKNTKNYILNGSYPNEIISFLNKIQFFNSNIDYDLLRRIISLIMSKKIAVIYSSYSDKNELNGVGIFLLSSYSCDILVLAAERNDKTIYSQIIDKFIKDNCEKTITLNYENIENEVGLDVFNNMGAKTFQISYYYSRKFPKIFAFFKKKQ